METTQSPASGSVHSERGYALPIILFLIALSAMVIAANLQVLRSTSKTTQVSKKQTERYYAVESALNKTGAWLREHSQVLSSVFASQELYSNFSRTPLSKGSNDTQFPTATKIKLLSTDYSVILTNTNTLGVSNFPPCSQTSGVKFYPSIEFGKLELGETLVKITLIDIIANDPALDYGPPPADPPQTNFKPLYRIDAMTAVDSGTHLYGYFLGDRMLQNKAGFFGQDYVNVRQNCDSYDSASGAYSPSSRTPSCEIQSRGSVCVSNNTEVYGNVSTTGVIDSSGACGGKICKDFSCSEASDSCEGPTCSVPSLPDFEDWQILCPPSQEKPSIVIANGESHSLQAVAGGSNCWSAISVQSGGTLQLTATGTPYFIKELELGNLEISPIPSDATVTLYVHRLIGERINGTQIINSISRPTQFELFYLGSNTLKVNGNSAIKMSLISPLANVEILGNNQFSGMVMARGLDLNGSAEVHHDTSSTPEIESDVRFKFIQISQFYR